MNERTNHAAGRDASIAAEAATWVMRQDRGLSPAEQDRYLQWLAADGRHREALATQRRSWEAFDRLAGLQSAVEVEPDPDLLRPPGRSPQPWVIRVFVPLAAAAALVVMFWPHQEFAPASSVRSAVAASVQLPPIEERVLEDGSMIRLNRGAKVSVEYAAAERRVRLEHGEAAFEVAHDTSRPFVVVSAGVSVRAVGTAFNVRLGRHAVEVIVTQGRVAVAEAGAPEADAAPIVDAGQRAVVPLGAEVAAPVVSTPAPEEMSRRLAWQPRLLTFSDQPLSVILEAFNRHNPVAIRSDEPALQELRLSARFRSDNVQGFLRLLESEFHVRVQQASGGEIVLRLVR